jgi:dihydrofolate reductase
MGGLLPTGLVDVFRLFVYPVVQGRGRRLFGEARLRQAAS